MQDCGDCIAVHASILTVDPVTLLSDSPYSELLAHDLTVAVFVNQYSIFSKINSTIMLLAALHYPSICSCASTLLLCSKLCQHNSPSPSNYWHCVTSKYSGLWVRPLMSPSVNICRVALATIQYIYL